MISTNPIFPDAPGHLINEGGIQASLFRSSGIEDHLNLRKYGFRQIIADPFHYLDCSVPTDGGGALLVTRADMLAGRKLTFDEESQALYDATAPTHDEGHFRSLLDSLESVLPGTGPIPASRRALVRRWDASV